MSGYEEIKKAFAAYTKHIPKGRIVIPPDYLDNVVCNTACPSWRAQDVSDVGSDFRNPLSPDYFRIGDCVFRIPPEQISVTVLSQTKQTVGLRQKDSVKSKTGYRQREIRVPVVFNGYDQINGYKVPGPFGIQYVDGLRPLIAQVKKTPFLPVENYHLNVNLNIHAVVIGGLSIHTVEDFPDLLEGELILYEFNAQPYLTLPTEAMNDMIDWDLFRWYYQRSMQYIDDNSTYLEPMNEDAGDWFKFYVIEEEVLAALTNAMEDVTNIQDYYMKEVVMPDDIYVKSIYVGMGNLIKSIFLSDHSAPTTQYLGATSSLISCTFQTQNEEAISIFNNLHELTEEYAKDYRNRNIQGYIRFDNAFTRLFGIKYVMIESCMVDTVPGFPDLYEITVVMSSYDKTQAKLHKPTGISPVNEQGDVYDLLTNRARGFKTSAYYDQLVEDMLDRIDLYPDLELPTVEEVNNAIVAINVFRIKNGLNPLPYASFAGTSKDRVEPDFYFCYPTMEQMGLLEIMEDASDIKEISDRIGQILRKTLNGETTGTVTDNTGVSVANPTTNLSIPTRTDYDMPWDQMKDIFKIYDTGVIYDIQTGITFAVQRTSGSNHANVETLTRADTEKMRKAVGGKWSWNRRPVVFLFKGKAYAASMNGMPHAGFDDLPEGAQIRWAWDTLRRPEEYTKTDYVFPEGGGTAGNMDHIKGNGMDGHFCLHFKGSKIHWSGNTDDRHQKAIQEAKQWIIQNNAEPKLLGIDVSGNEIKSTKPISDTATPVTEIPGIVNSSKATTVDIDRLGEPIRVKVGEPIDNTSEGLTERMCVDMIRYNRRGTMARAFPTFLMLFVDEGMWLDGRRSWSNYYVWHSLCNISVEKDRHKPADTATIQLINIYNSLGTNPKVDRGEYSFFNEFLKSLKIYSYELLSQLTANRSRLLSAFNVKPGARIHIRIGYGAKASDLPVVFNGTIAEVNTQDVVTVVAQGDGYELTLRPVGINKEDEVNRRIVMGAEPENIITYLLTARAKPFWFNMSGGRWGEMSKYGIEHFGTLYYRDMEAFFRESLKFYGLEDHFEEVIMDDGGLDKLLYAIMYGAIQIDSGLRSILLHLYPAIDGQNVHYEDLDIIKNIYKANLKGVVRTQSKNKDIKITELWDREPDIKFYIYNRTPWDICQLLAAAVPEYICQPHSHQFRSTLFYGMPHWNVQYKYEYDYNTDTVYTYAKPFQQLHIVNSLYDIIDNKIRAVPPEFTAVIPTYNLGNEAETKRGLTLFADSEVKGEMQKHKMLDTTIYWNTPGPQVLDNILPIFGIDPGGNVSRTMGISALQDAFKDMYQDTLLILGDASIKPYDVIAIDDNYVGMAGTTEVGKVIIHMGIDTGFVTEIKPDLITVHLQADMSRYTAIHLCANIAAAIGVHVRSAKLCAKLVRGARKLFSGIKAATSSSTAVTTITTQGANVLKSTTGVKNVVSAVKAAKTSSTAMKVGTAIGTGVVSFGISLLIWGLIDNVFDHFVEWFENKNVIKIYPLWYDDKPFVAGINGHKNLIPGYTDSDFYQNYESDSEEKDVILHSTKVTQALLGDEGNRLSEQFEKESQLLTPKEEDRKLLEEYNNYLEENYAYTIWEHKNTWGQKNTVANPPEGIENTYRPINANFYEKEVDGIYYAGFYGKHSESSKTLYGQFPVFAFADGKVILVAITRSTLEEMQAKRPQDQLTSARASLKAGFDRFIVEMRHLFDPLKNEMQYNTVIVIEHSSKDSNGKLHTWMTIYGSLLTSFVVPGDVVKGGQPIGVAGALTRMINAVPGVEYPKFQIITDGENARPSYWMEEKYWK